MYDIAKKLQEARESLMYTIQTLAMKLNLSGYSISKKAIEKYEAGEIEPPVSYIKALVDILNINPYFLLADAERVTI